MSLPPDAMPGGCHPAYEQDAGFIRQWMHRNDDVLRIPYWSGPSLLARASDDPATYPTPGMSSIKAHTLTRKKCAGPVPSVGPRQMLWWWVFTDELGRSVASYYVHRYTNPHGLYYREPRGWPLGSSWFNADDGDALAGWA